MRLRQKLGAALAEAERLAAGALHLPRQKYPHADERDEGEPGDEQRHEPRHVVLLRPRGDRHALAVEPLDQARVIRCVGLEAAAVGEGPVDLGTLDQHVAHPALIDLGEQLREGNVLRRGTLPRILEQGEQREKQQHDDHPEGEIAQIGVHPVSFMAPAPPAARSLVPATQGDVRAPHSGDRSDCPCPGRYCARNWGRFRSCLLYTSRCV